MGVQTLPASAVGRKNAIKAIGVVNKKLKAGHPASPLPRRNKIVGAGPAAANELGVDPWTLSKQVGTPNKGGSWKRQFGFEPNWALKSKVDLKKEQERELFEPYLVE